MMQVLNEMAAPEQIVDKSGGSFVSLPFTNCSDDNWLPFTNCSDDNGLGFTQGSTDGVFNTYYRGGFLRPELPPIDRATRRRFNLRGYRGLLENWSCGWPYACHYDPAPFYKEQPGFQDDNVWSSNSDDTFSKKEKVKKPGVIKPLILLLGLIIALWVVFGR